MAAIVDLSMDVSLPTTVEGLREFLGDPIKRISSGMYKILVKGDEGDDDAVDQVMNFKPNRAQIRFIRRMWHRNIILKARQLGFTTLICILWLDHALFNSNQRCAVVAHNRESAEVIFRDKVKFAYHNLPPALLARFPLARNSASELLFAHNNSAIRVATSVRSGTTQRLLVSEFGKICADNPKKAAEVVTGTIPTVPLNGITVIESTAEGQEGSFYKMSKRSQAAHEASKELTPRDYRFHFYAWWQEPKYRMDPRGVQITREDNAYFDEKEAELGVTIDEWQRAWYCATRDEDFSGEDEKMWQEYPTTADEAFQKSTEGVYYAKQLTLMRKQGRILDLPYMPGAPVNTFWDIGLNDRMAIWFHQRIGPWDHFIDYYEAEGEGLNHYKRQFDERPYTYGKLYLPHDAAKRQHKEDAPETFEMLMQRVGFKNTVIVPRIENVLTGIEMTRSAMSSYRIDKDKCKLGLAHLGNYRKQWSEQRGTWMDAPLHNTASNAADAIRQHAQGFTPGDGVKKPKRKTASWRAQ